MKISRQALVVALLAQAATEGVLAAPLYQSANAGGGSSGAISRRQQHEAPLRSTEAPLGRRSLVASSERRDAAGAKTAATNEAANGDVPVPLGLNLTELNTLVALFLHPFFEQLHEADAGKAPIGGQSSGVMTTPATSANSNGPGAMMNGEKGDVGVEMHQAPPSKPFAPHEQSTPAMAPASGDTVSTQSVPQEAKGPQYNSESRLESSPAATSAQDTSSVAGMSYGGDTQTPTSTHSETGLPSQAGAATVKRASTDPPASSSSPPPPPQSPSAPKDRLAHLKGPVVAPTKRPGGVASEVISELGRLLTSSASPSHPRRGEDGQGELRRTEEALGKFDERSEPTSGRQSGRDYGQIDEKYFRAVSPDAISFHDVFSARDSKRSYDSDPIDLFSRAVVIASSLSDEEQQYARDELVDRASMADLNNAITGPAGPLARALSAAMLSPSSDAEAIARRGLFKSLLHGLGSIIKSIASSAGGSQQQSRRSNVDSSHLTQNPFGPKNLNDARRSGYFPPVGVPLDRFTPAQFYGRRDGLEVDARSVGSIAGDIGSALPKIGHRSPAILRPPGFVDPDVITARGEQPEAGSSTGSPDKPPPGHRSTEALGSEQVYDRGVHSRHKSQRGRHPLNRRIVDGGEGLIPASDVDGDKSPATRQEPSPARRDSHTSEQEALGSYLLPLTSHARSESTSDGRGIGPYAPQPPNRRQSNDLEDRSEGPSEGRGIGPYAPPPVTERDVLTRSSSISDGRGIGPYAPPVTERNIMARSTVSDGRGIGPYAPSHPVRRSDDGESGNEQETIHTRAGSISDGRGIGPYKPVPPTEPSEVHARSDSISDGRGIGPYKPAPPTERSEISNGRGIGPYKPVPPTERSEVHARSDSISDGRGIGPYKPAPPTERSEIHGRSESISDGRGIGPYKPVPPTRRQANIETHAGSEEPGNGRGIGPYAPKPPARRSSEDAVHFARSEPPNRGGMIDLTALLTSAYGPVNGKVHFGRNVGDDEDQPGLKNPTTVNARAEPSTLPDLGGQAGPGLHVPEGATASSLGVMNVRQEQAEHERRSRLDKLGLEQQQQPGGGHGASEAEHTLGVGLQKRDQASPEPPPSRLEAILMGKRQAGAGGGLKLLSSSGGGEQPLISIGLQRRLLALALEEEAGRA